MPKFAPKDQTPPTPPAVPTPPQAQTNPSVSPVDVAALLTTGEVAKLLKVSPRHVQKMMQHSAIPYIELGRKCVRFDRQDVLAHIKNKYGVEAIDCDRLM